MSCERYQPQTCFATRLSCLEEALLTPKCPGDTEGGWEKALPSLDNQLTTLKSSFQSYTDLDDMTAK